MITRKTLLSPTDGVWLGSWRPPWKLGEHLIYMPYCLYVSMLRNSDFAYIPTFRLWGNPSPTSFVFPLSRMSSWPDVQLIRSETLPVAAEQLPLQLLQAYGHDTLAILLRDHPADVFLFIRLCFAIRKRNLSRDSIGIGITEMLCLDSDCGRISGDQLSLRKRPTEVPLPSSEHLG